MNTSEISKTALFGKDTDKVRAFAILVCENDEKTEKLKYHAKNLSIKYTDMATENHCIMVYNVPLYEAKRLAGMLELKAFMFGTNAFPAVMDCYESKNGGKTYYSVKSKEVTYLKEAEEFFNVKIGSECCEDIKAVSEAIINEAMINWLFNYELTPWGCKMRRLRAEREE